jgi:hypothetical protein
MSAAKSTNTLPDRLASTADGTILRTLARPAAVTCRAAPESLSLTAFTVARTSPPIVVGSPQAGSRCTRPLDGCNTGIVTEPAPVPSAAAAARRSSPAAPDIVPIRQGSTAIARAWTIPRSRSVAGARTIPWSGTIPRPGAITLCCDTNGHRRESAQQCKQGRFAHDWLLSVVLPERLSGSGFKFSPLCGAMTGCRRLFPGSCTMTGLSDRCCRPFWRRLTAWHRWIYSAESTARPWALVISLCGGSSW